MYIYIYIYVGSALDSIATAVPWQDNINLITTIECILERDLGNKAAPQKNED
jgi:hypothetical protein